MKTKEELNALRNEVETLNKKLGELTEEELTQVTGGFSPDDMHIWDIISGAPVRPESGVTE